MSDQDEKHRSGLDRAKAIERFEDAEYAKRFDVGVWDKKAERWRSPRERLADFKESVDACGKYGCKPVTHTTAEPRDHVESVFEVSDVSKPVSPTLKDGQKGSWESIGQTGTVRPLFDFEEIAPEDFYDPAKRPEFLEARQARDVYGRICEDETGTCGDPVRLQAQWSENEQLKQDAHRIAGRIERESQREADFHNDPSLFVPMYRKTEYGVFAYYLFSKVRVQAPKFRNSNFLPYVASMNRGKMLKDLEYYLSRFPFSRMWTFTSGKRVGLEGVRERVQWLHRRLSKLNTWLKTMGLEIVFRSTELGTPETEKGEGFFEREEGEIRFHVHAHCLVKPLKDRPFTKKRWRKIVKSVWRKWGLHWDDGKSVRDARELCKYVSKPAALLELQDWELLKLYREINSLRLITPMGSLKSEIRTRKEKKLRLVKERTPNGEGRVFKEVPDWNCNRNTKDDQLEKAEKEIKDARQGEVEQEIRILAKCEPGFAPGSLVKEPRLIVLATNWDQRALERHPLVQKLMRELWEEWQAGQAASRLIRVHTGTITVPGDFSFFGDSPHFDEPPQPETFDFYKECTPC